MYGSEQGWSLSTYPIHVVQKTTTALKNARILRVNVFSKKVLIRDTIFLRDRYFTWSSEPREGVPVCRAKGVPSFLSYFKTLCIDPAPGIEPATSRSAVERSTD